MDGELGVAGSFPSRGLGSAGGKKTSAFRPSPGEFEAAKPEHSRGEGLGSLVVVT